MTQIITDAATPTVGSGELPLCLPYQPLRITVRRYHELINQGVFSENERCELLEGVVVEKMTKNPPHVVANRRCEQRFASLLPPGWHVRSQDPLTLAQSEPEPDVAIVRGRFEDYATRHPAGDDVALVVEVADASLATDRYKVEIYAAAGIPCYWILNLVDRVVEVYTSPVTAGAKSSYANVRRCAANDEIAVFLADQEVARLSVADLLG